MTVSLPNDYQLRTYQRGIWRYFAGGGKRGVSVWHRRAGKDLTAIHRTAVEAHKRVGTYWHMLPQQAQARKVIWDGIVYKPDRSPIKIIDWAFPQALRKKTNQQEMKIEFHNGSVWQLCGSDNYDSLVGANPVGAVFSEYSVSKPSAWEYIRPILTENGGWAHFCYTPRGLNHGFELFQMAQENPKWFSELLTVRETSAISEEAIQEERDSGMSEDMVEQEFFCSFSAAMVGSYFGKMLIEAKDAGRIRDVPYDPTVPVQTGWDIGVHDHTSIWMMQALKGGELRAIDYLEGTGAGAEYYIGELLKKPYVWGTHHVPHDFQARGFAANGKSAWDIGKTFGMKMNVIPKMAPLDRIQASRLVIPRVYWDKDKTKLGRDALLNYHKTWDPDRKTFAQTPDHDWSSHPADAFGTFAVGYRDQAERSTRQIRQRLGPPTAHNAGWMGR